MLRNIIILALCGLGYYACAHPHCHFNQREVNLERELTFCSMDYAEAGVCCTEEEEATLEATLMSAVGDLTTECADYYQQVIQQYISYSISEQVKAFTPCGTFG